MGGVGDLRAFPYGYCYILLQPAVAYVNWPKTPVLSEGRYSITLKNTTSTRPDVPGGGGYGSMLEGEHISSRQIRRALTYVTCVVSVIILNNEDLFIHMLNDIF
jgi:hypothetical protein